MSADDLPSKIDCGPRAVPASWYKRDYYINENGQKCEAVGGGGLMVANVRLVKSVNNNNNNNGEAEEDRNRKEVVIVERNPATHHRQENRETVEEEVEEVEEEEEEEEEGGMAREFGSVKSIINSYQELSGGIKVNSSHNFKKVGFFLISHQVIFLLCP